MAEGEPVRGKDREFDEFFAAVWPRARAMGARMGLGREEAEDVALDTAAVAYDRWARVRDLDYREAWVFKVTANLALRRVKRHSRRPLSAPVRWTASLEEDITRRLALRGVVVGLLADLPEDEVAHARGINIGSVKQHASRGRAALRDTLSGLEVGAGNER